MDSLVTFIACIGIPDELTHMNMTLVLVLVAVVRADTMLSLFIGVIFVEIRWVLRLIAETC